MVGKSSPEVPQRQLWEMNNVWDALTFEEKEFVNRNVEICHYKKNDIIHHEGDYPTHVMMLGSGKLRVYKEGVGQKPQIIRMLKPNDFFAYRAMIADENYNTNMQLIQQNSKFCYLLMIVMAKDLGRSDEKVVNLTQKHIRGRLAEALLSLKQNYGLDEDGATISMYMSREDLANLSNMTTANAIRTLSQFAQEGIISIDGRKIKILDNAALTKISRVG